MLDVDNLVNDDDGKERVARAVENELIADFEL